MDSRRSGRDNQGVSGPVRELRIRAGLTQQELAERSGVSVRTVRALENGAVAQPQATSLRRLAAVLGVDPTALLAAAAPGSVRVEVLGPLTVRRGRAVIAVASPMLRKLLGLLAIQPGREVGFDEIIDTLWEGSPPRTCRQLVHTYVGGLRQLLDESVVPRTVQGYRLLLEDGQSDVAEFGERVARAERAAADGAGLAAWQLYTEAVNCWRGPLLGGGLTLHPAAIALTSRRTAAVLAWAELGLTLGKYSPMVPALRTLAADQPLHEGLAARMMLALAGDGQQAEALAVYEELRTRLSDELGVDPGPEVTSAHLRVLRGQLPGSALVSGAAPPAAEPPSQLPTECAGFTGRAHELRALGRILTAGKVAVITGMGGVGKTALAVTWARRERGRYPDGQLYADLRGHSATGPARPLEVLAGFLSALGESAERIPEDEDQAAALLRTRTEGKRILLLLDNALDPQQVRPLLPAGPGNAAIVTARDRMTGLVARDGAETVLVRPLPEAEAAALVVTAMGGNAVGRNAVGRNAVGRNAAGDVAELARLCAQLPLALRIAAANIAARPGYPLADYVARLASGDRLTRLAVPEDPRAAVRTAFELSCDALKPELRRMFRLAGLAPGSDLTAAAAAALADIAIGEAESLLAGLVARNLVDEYTFGRYRLHDLLRLYAAELAESEESAAERDAAIGRLAAHAMATARSAAALLYPHRLHLPDDDEPDGDPFADGAAALAWLDAERANLVALVAALADRGRTDAAVRIADRLAGYFFMRSSTVDWLVAATAARRAAGEVPIAVASAELQLGMLRGVQARYEAAAGHFTESLRQARRAGWVAAEAVTMNNLAVAYWALGRTDETIALFTEALQAHRRSGRTAGEAVTLANIAAARLVLARSADTDDERGQHREEALRLLTQASDMHQALGDRLNQAETRRLFAEAYRDLGDQDTACRYARQAIGLAREAADQGREASARSTLATILVRLGDAEGGLAEHTRARAAAAEHGDLARQAYLLADLAESLAWLGREQEALITAQDASAAAGRLRLPALGHRAQRVLDDCRAGRIRTGGLRDPNAAR
jgi:DNA-binding SARP family transcriptional activator/tetratricopeptide (TPR) repeat protein/DNA-binding XRE family transcriptional regulator